MSSSLMGFALKSHSLMTNKGSCDPGLQQRLLSKPRGCSRLLQALEEKGLSEESRGNRPESRGPRCSWGRMVPEAGDGREVAAREA